MSYIRSILMWICCKDQYKTMGRCNMKIQWWIRPWNLSVVLKQMSSGWVICDPLFAITRKPATSGSYALGHIHGARSGSLLHVTVYFDLIIVIMLEVLLAFHKQIRTKVPCNILLDFISISEYYKFLIKKKKFGLKF